jgi:hypothetical protein
MRISTVFRVALDADGFGVTLHGDAGAQAVDPGLGRGFEVQGATLPAAAIVAFRVEDVRIVEYSGAGEDVDVEAGLEDWLCVAGANPGAEG